VVDDEAAIREVLSLHLEAAGLRVIALDSARALLERGLEKVARCIVSDIRMPDIDGLELQQELNQRGAGVPFIVVTAHGDIPLAVRAMRAGAVDVLEKPFRPAGLLSAIERALKQSSHAAREERARSRERLESLTSREKEVFEFLAQGKPSRVIAGALGVSQRTVDGHRASVMHKLNVRTVGELVRIAVGAE
jgi:two-component system response regulator FixJ